MQIQIPELDPESLRLDARARRMARRFCRDEYELLSVVKEVDQANLWKKFGLTSTHQYCLERLRLTRDVACNHIRVARACRHVPAFQVAIKEGLGVSLARKIAPVVTAENCAEWVAKAKTLTQAQLEAEIAGFTGEALLHHLKIAPEVHEMLKRAQDLECQRQGKDVTLSDTLKSILAAHLEAKDPVHKAKRARKSSSYDDNSSAAASKIPAAVIHEVNLRDKGCCQMKLPNGKICGRRRWIDYHHMHPRSKGGKHTADNIITLCSAHHRMWHRMMDAP